MARLLTRLIGPGMLLAAGFATTASAATVTVTATADASGPCGGGKCPSLRSAVAVANATPGTTIRLRAGTYPLHRGELQVSAATKIIGAGAGRTTIRQADGISRVFNFWNAAVSITLQGLTVTGGHLGPGQSELGAGILTNSPLTLTDVGVTGNTAVGGTPSTVVSCCQAVAGIVSLRSLTISHSTISDNVATGGDGAAGQPGGEAVSAILATQAEPVRIVGSTIANNVARAGVGGAGSAGPGGAGGSAYGAVYDIDASPLTVIDSVFSGNRSTAGTGGAGTPGGNGGGVYGGALFVPDGVLDVRGSTFAGNVIQAGAGASGGAGGEAFGGAIGGGSRSKPNSILNSTFDANAANAGAGTPGGLAVGGAVAENTTFQLAIVSSTFTANVASSPGGSTYGGNLYDQPTPITLADDIFSGGRAGSAPSARSALPSPTADTTSSRASSSRASRTVATCRPPSTTCSDAIRCWHRCGRRVARRRPAPRAPTARSSAPAARASTTPVRRRRVCEPISVAWLEAHPARSGRSKRRARAAPPAASTESSITRCGETR